MDVSPDCGRDRVSQIKVALLFERMGPYHHARLAAASGVTRVRGFQLYAMDSTYAWEPMEETGDISLVTLFDSPKAVDYSARETRRRLTSRLDEFGPDAVAIPGWSEPFALAALEWCVSRGKMAIMMSESTAADEQRSWWKEWVKRHIVGICSAGLVGGAPHAAYIKTLNIPANAVFVGYDAIDNDYFASQSQLARLNRMELRSKFRLPEKFFLASARFVLKKNLSRLIEAYAAYHDATGAKPWDLVLLGDGELRESLETQIKNADLSEHIHLPGFVQYPDLPTYYGLAGAFVHASTTEQWGLVVNEAMASRLPVLVSNRCGCATDLVQEGVNGFTFAPTKVEQLAALMLRVSSPEFPLNAFGSASQKIISQWSPKQFAEGLMRSLHQGLSAQKKNGVFQPLLTIIRWLQQRHL